MNLFIQFKNNGTNETVMIETGIYLLWNFFQDFFNSLFLLSYRQNQFYIDKKKERWQLDGIMLRKFRLELQMNWY